MSEPRFPVQVEERIRFRDLDALGHLNNSVYFTFFEQARITYMERLGLLGKGAPARENFILLETNCRFLIPGKMGDRVTAEARVLDLGNTSVTMEYRLRRGDDVMATGRGVVVYFDYVDRKKVPLPPEMRATIAEIEGWER